MKKISIRKSWLIKKLDMIAFVDIFNKKTFNVMTNLQKRKEIIVVSSIKYRDHLLL
jgi:hypothetical protein